MPSSKNKNKSKGGGGSNPASAQAPPPLPAQEEKKPEKKAEKIAENQPEEKKQKVFQEDSKNGTTNKTDLDVVAEVLAHFNLNDSGLDLQGKLNALAVMFHEVTKENVKMKDEMKNLLEQLSKQDETKGALQKLIGALKTQIELTREEGDLKLKEETQKRIECSKNFQDTMTDLSGLISTHSGHNDKLKNENILMSQKLGELMASYEKRETRLGHVQKEQELQTKLFEAKLAKAKIEKAEMNMDFTKERLEMHKQLLEATQLNEELLSKHTHLQDQVDTYQTQYKAMESDMGSSTKNFDHFRKEMERLGKQLRTVERDTGEWKEKYESSNEQVRKMNSVSMEREKELTAVKKKLGAMEKLNRTLQTERVELMKKTEKNGN